MTQPPQHYVTDYDTLGKCADDVPASIVYPMDGGYLAAFTIDYAFDSPTPTGGSCQGQRHFTALNLPREIKGVVQRFEFVICYPNLESILS